MGRTINTWFVGVLLACFVLPLIAEEAEQPHWVQNDAGKYGLVSAAGDTLTRFKYDTVWAFYNNVSPVKKDNMVGLVNYKGKEIAKPVYQLVQETFGNVSIHPRPHGKARLIGWVYSQQVTGTTWVDINGKTLATGTKSFFTLRDKVPEGLWDY